MKKLLIFGLSLLVFILAVTSCKKTTYTPGNAVNTSFTADTFVTYEVTTPTLNNPFIADNCTLVAEVTDLSGQVTTYSQFTSDCPSIGSLAHFYQTIHLLPTTKQVRIVLTNYKTTMSYSATVKGQESFGQVIELK